MPELKASLNQMLQIDSLCESFEAEWTSGQAPSIEAYLDKVADNMRPELLRELLGLELSRQVKLGRAVSRDEYRQRFSKYLPDVELTLQKILGSAAAKAAPPGALAPPAAPATGKGSTRNQDLDETFGVSDSRFAAKTLDPASGPPLASDSPAPQPPAIGRYEYRACLGRGASGTVYRAWDPKIARDVAVKILHDRGEQPGKLDERVVQETNATKSLRHPHIVGIHDVGVAESGECYIVMDFVDGRTLHSVLRERKSLSVKEAVELVSKLADAIAAAHRQRTFHRDLKPGNVLIGPDGEPCIVDFGLAIHESTQRARRGEKAGTWPYMSPEQIHGEAHLLDGRADIWALGVILYEALAGKRPFDGGDVGEIIEEIFRKDPTPLRQFNSSVSAELDRIVRKALAKNVAERYATAQDLANDLRKLDQPPVQPPPRRSGWLEMAVTTAGAAAACFLGTLLVLWLLGVMFRQPKFEPAVSFDTGNSNHTKDLVKNDREDVVFAGQYLFINAENEDPVYWYVFWLDEKGKAHRIPAQDSDERRRKTYESQAVPVGDNPGHNCLFAAVSGKPVNPKQLAKIEREDFKSDARGPGKPVPREDDSRLFKDYLNTLIEQQVLKAYEPKPFEIKSRPKSAGT